MPPKKQKQVLFEIESTDAWYQKINEENQKLVCKYFVSALTLILFIF